MKYSLLPFSSSSDLPYLTTLFCTLLSLIPYFLGWKFNYEPYDEHTAPITLALRSSELCYAIVAACSVSCPIILEFLFDKFSSSKKYHQVHISFHWLAALIIPTICLFGIAITLKIPEVMPTIIYSQRLFYAHNFYFEMKTWCPAIWDCNLTKLYFIGISANFIVAAWDPFISLSADYEIVLRVFVGLCSLGIFLKSLQWYKYIYFATRFRPMTLQEYCCNIYSISYLFAVAGITILFGTMELYNKKFIEFHATYFSLCLYLSIFLTILVTMAHMRVLRLEMILTQVRNAHKYLTQLFALSCFLVIGS